MLTYELTSEQQDFAEKNHNLIYGFLRDKKLPMDDYYDVVVFGYLRAVRQYCSRGDLRRRYTFGTIAYQKMKDDLFRHFKAQARPSRNAATVSLESLAYGGEMLTLAEVIAAPDDMQENLEASMLWELLAGSLTGEQIQALRLRADGYNDYEIAARRKRRVSDVKGMFADIQAAALSLCLA